jgi:hypothetical protein
MHDGLSWTYVVASVAAVTASALAVVTLVLWVRARRQGRSAASARVALLISATVIGLSAGWLIYQRHQKCKPTVSRTLCESPIDWFGCS